MSGGRMGRMGRMGQRGQMTAAHHGSHVSHASHPSHAPVPAAIGQPERATQERVIALFRDTLGYRYLGNWHDRPLNSNIDEPLLTAYLSRNGYTTPQIRGAIRKIHEALDNFGRGLYENNRLFYGLLRYGIKVQAAAGEHHATVELINWKEPGKNDFAIAEEVTLKGDHERRPDIVLYVNGIAVGVLELKSSRVSIGDGIRQNLSNQRPEFNAWFFGTVQFVLAGNDSEGLRYGTIGTPEKVFMAWKEDEAENAGYKLDKYLRKMCEKARLIELMRDFVLFDGGIKKLPRVHQYFGIQAAQTRVRERRGGIIWHTQGSGKSLVMVLLTRWILENNPHARVAVITDRDELDEQIERVFTEAGETIYRTDSGRDLMRQLGRVKPRLLCSLVHKFGPRGKRQSDEQFDRFVREIEDGPSRTVGDVFVFVDECHRTQSGRLHRVMKAMMPNAVFIGFTGTPLLSRDRATTLETFDSYIHTYKFNEAVDDKVVLDLVYEARDIDQQLGSEEKIDAWFEAKTRGLNDWQKDELRKHWGTLQKVLSSRSRMERVASDILFDFSVKPRLSSERGNAMLVASSIYEACKYYELFQKTPFKGLCAVVTSYNPQIGDITLEDTGCNNETDKQFVYHLYDELLRDVTPKPRMTKAETYEHDAKNLFIKDPARMKLLIVVDKLLTGFDAPACTYLYIDKTMQDHGLFQAICRTNRLDGDDKDYGYIVDYKDLFRRVENAIAVYTSELDRSAGGSDPEVLLEDRLKKGRRRVDEALEALALHCEPVEPPKGELEHIHYFCGNTELPDDLKRREPLRANLYKATASLVRAYGGICDELALAGYTVDEAVRLKQQVKLYVDLRETIRKASGESLDLKPYEADMRHLIDMYIEAKEARKVSPWEEMTLLELIVKSGIADAINSLPPGIRGDRAAAAETIENNVRSKIIKSHLSDPAFYEKMSALLDEIIRQRRAEAIAYEEYLRQIAALARQVQEGKSDNTPSALDSPGKRALFNNLLLKASDARQAGPGEERSGYGAAESGQALELALTVDAAVKAARPDDWRGNKVRENVVKEALYGIVRDETEVERLFAVITAQPEY